jgi:EAL domain-containing protein (putative c-di-GMP-specific phosphodiesterase class I)
MAQAGIKWQAGKGGGRPGPRLGGQAQADPLTDPVQQAMASRDQDVLSIVRAAIAAGSARLAFQAIHVARGNSIAFHEGLIRVIDQAGRIVPAAQFMPQIEDKGLGRDIDCATLRLGVQMLAHNPRLKLSMNVSARSIGDAAWRRALDDTLQRAPGIGPRMILEISETSAMMLPELVIRFMAEMQPKGLSFAMDGFGGGMTSFRYLKDFFFDIVKIDRVFVRGIHASPDNQVIAQALISVARQFDMYTVAEGVETPEEAQMLTALGVDCLQGYLFGVPRFEL